MLLTGEITNAEALAKIATDVGPNTQEVRTTYCTNLTTVDLSMITSLTEIYVTGNSVLQTLNFSNLQTVDHDMTVTSCPVLANMPVANLALVAHHLKLYGLGITNLNLPLLKKVDGEIWVNGNNVLVSINLPQLLKGNRYANDNYYDFPSLISYTKIQSNPVLNSIILSVFPEASVLQITDNVSLQTLSVPLLVKAKNITFNNNGVTSVLFPALKKAGHLEFQNNNQVTSLSFPVLDSLVSLDGFLAGDIENEHLVASLNRSLQSISFPLLKSCEAVIIEKDSALTSVSLPLLNEVTANSYFFVIDDCIILTSIVVDGLAHVVEQIDFSGNKLSSTQVNYLLHIFATMAVQYSDRVITLTQIVAAPPTGQGLTDKATLQSHGNTVYTD